MSSLDPKYIIFDNPDSSEVAVVFSSTIPHNLIGSYHRLGKAISVGFFYMTNNEAFAYGESESLKLKSRPKEDGLLLDQTLRLGRYLGQ